MTRIREFLGTLVGIVAVLGLAFFLISTLEIGTDLWSEDQQVRAVVSTSEPVSGDEDLEIHVSSTSEPALQDEIQQFQGTPVAEPTSPTTFLSPLPEPGLEEIWFSMGGELYRQPLDDEGRFSAPMSRIPLELPPNGAVSSVLRISPDGRRVVYIIEIVPEECGEGCDGSWAMYVLDFSTGESRYVTGGGPGGPKFLGWHLDSQHLKFGNEDGEVSLINVDTGERTIVGEVLQWADLPYSPLVDGMALSPDRKWMVVSFTLTGSGGEIWMVKADGSEARMLSEGYRAGGMSWSPNGQYVAFVGRGVEVMDAGGQNRRTVVGAYTGGGIYPAWSPDSRYLVFGTFEEVTITETRHLVQIVDVVGGTSVYLGQDLAGGASGPAWSPDGRQVVFASDWSREELGYSEFWVANRDGTGLRQLILGQTKLSNPVWLAPR